jgi:hypothetical protein
MPPAQRAHALAVPSTRREVTRDLRQGLAAPVRLSGAAPWATPSLPALPRLSRPDTTALPGVPAARMGGRHASRAPRNTEKDGSRWSA